MPELDNAQHERFAVEYMRDFNATAAARRCGYSENYGRELLRNPSVKSRVVELRDELNERTGITADRIARAYSEMAFYDGRDLALVLDFLRASDVEGKSLSDMLDALPRAVTAPIKELSLRVDTRSGAKTYSVKAYDRQRALDVLSERFWTVAEADDDLVRSIQSLRDKAVPDMSEDNGTTHATRHAGAGDLADIPDVPAMDDDDDDGETPKWRLKGTR